MLLEGMNVHGVTAALRACDVAGRWRNAMETCFLAILARVEAGIMRQDGLASVVAPTYLLSLLCNIYIYYVLCMQYAYINHHNNHSKSMICGPEVA